MKTFYLSLFLLTKGCVAATNDEANPSMLRRTLTNTNRRPQKIPCVVYLVHKQFLDHRVEEQPLECELQSADVMNVKKSKMFKVSGLSTKWAIKNEIESGVTTLFASDSVIDDDSNEVIIPTNETIKLGRLNQSAKGTEKASGLGSWDPSDTLWNRKLQNVVKSVLVLRIQGADSATTASETQLTDDVFGAAGDPVNLKTRFNQCSYGKLQFEPIATNAQIGTDGVYTVSLPTTTVTGANDNTLAWAAVDKAAADLGVTSLTSIANHVIVCIPPGTAGSWIAWAYVNHWMSAYNNAWCGYPTALVHEVGHNLNLAHSGEGTNEYDDQSGSMGYSYEQDDGPVMCYNGPKTWQLGWFPEYHVDLTSATGFGWTGSLVGFAEKISASVTDKMIIRIQGSSSHTYINFNRAIGINSGTQEGANQVLVTTRATGLGYAVSTLVGKLSANGVYSIPNFNGSSSTLRITVTSIVTSSTPARAGIAIALITTPPTQTPTRAPTLAPTAFPTRAPTAFPTRAPTLAPTAFPTLTPTESPTGAPQFPTESQAPSDAPTTPSPTQAPTRAPTELPTEAPTRAPTASPTQAPTRIPTRSPTRVPTKAMGGNMRRIR